jgi:hypothetical protein
VNPRRMDGHAFRRHGPHLGLHHHARRDVDEADTGFVTVAVGAEFGGVRGHADSGEDGRSIEAAGDRSNGSLAIIVRCPA